MKRIQIGNDFRVSWALTQLGEAFSLVGKTYDIEVSSPYGVILVSDVVAENNILSFGIPASQQVYLGNYDITLKITNEEGQTWRLKQCDAFALVPCDCGEIVEVVQLSSGIVYPRNGLSAYELAVLNGEYTGDYDGYQRWLARYAENTANEAVNIANEANSKADGANENSKQAVALSKSANENSSKALTLSQQASEKSESAEEKASEAETLAKNAAQQEGIYPNLTSGFADNLVGRGEATPEVFTFRQSGGNTSINDGTARLKSIKGNSVVFKQIASPSVGSAKVEKTNNGRTLLCTPIEKPATPGGMNYSNGWVYPAFNQFVPERYYCFSFEYKRISKRTDIDDFTPKESIRIAINSNGIDIPINIGEAKHIECILKCPSDTNNAFITLNDCIVEINDLQVFDLTTMFGAGNEPQTVEEFRALYPYDYYEYNAGEIINSNYTAIESVGFNAFDGELEVGAYSNTTGLPAESDTYSRSKNYIEVLSGEKYYFYAKTGISYIRVRCYDSNYNFISYIGTPYSPNSDNSPNYNNPITIPNGASYITFDTNRTLDIAQNLDICLNLVHTGYRNGQYEPYRKDVINLPNIELKKAGNVYDEVRYNPNSEKWEYVQRVITRAYEEGDADKADVITDGVNTNVAAVTPIITELEGDYSTDYIVSDFGTEKAITDKLCAPFSADIIYQFNAVDRIRENSAKIAQLEALIVELNSKLLAQEASVNNINIEEE